MPCVHSLAGFSSQGPTRMKKNALIQRRSEAGSEPYALIGKIYTSLHTFFPAVHRRSGNHSLGIVMDTQRHSCRAHVMYLYMRYQNHAFSRQRF